MIKFANSLLLSYFKYLGLFLRLFADNDDGADGAATLARMAFGWTLKWDIELSLKSKSSIWTILESAAAVVEQVVEQWLSLPAVRVRIPSRTLALFGSDGHSILAGCQASSNNGVIKWCLTLPCFISISYHHVIWQPNLSTDVPRKKNKIEKEAGKGQY